jgi:hypothetical protein
MSGVVFGEDAYPASRLKAAALLHSVADQQQRCGTHGFSPA